VSCRFFAAGKKISVESLKNRIQRFNQPSGQYSKPGFEILLSVGLLYGKSGGSHNRGE